MQDFRSSSACCLDAGFGRPLSEMLRGMDDQSARTLFFRLVESTARSGRLGIFNLECQHHTTSTAVNSSKLLGRAKNFSSISAESFLNAIKQHHADQFKKHQNQRLGLGCVELDS